MRLIGQMPRVGRRPRWGDVDARLWLERENLEGVEGGERGMFAMAGKFAGAGADRLARAFLIKSSRLGSSSSSMSGYRLM